MLIAVGAQCLFVVNNLKKLLIVKNVSRGGPGIISTVLAAKKVPFEVVDLSAGEAFPDPAAYCAVIVLGGPQSANDDTPKMRHQIMRIKECLQKGIPFLGVCLGMQALVKAGGGWVMPARSQEIGWRDHEGRHYEIELTEAGSKDALFSAMPRSIKIFQLHGETVRLADGMSLLATARHCYYQVVKVGERAYGLQGHFELTPEMFSHWLAQDELLKKHYPGHMRTDYSHIKNEYELNGRVMLANFLEIAGIA